MKGTKVAERGREREIAKGRVRRGGCKGHDDLRTLRTRAVTDSLPHVLALANLLRVRASVALSAPAAL